MPVSYTQTLSFDTVIADLDLLNHWRHALMRVCIFGGAQTPVSPHIASQTVAWCEEQAAKGAIDAIDAQRLSGAHRELVQMAQVLLEGAMAGQPVTPENYDLFESRCAGFASQILQFEKKQVIGASGVESLMNLRPLRELRNDIKREQDRLDRKGSSFSVAAVQIDGLEGLATTYTPEQLDKIFIHVSGLIARTIRSFDDAYYAGNGGYMVALKHLEFMDACAVMDRLRGEIERTEVPIDSALRVAITASCGVAEAIQGEPFEDTIKNARSSLEKAKKQGGNQVVEHQEMSSLARYVKDNKFE